MLVLKTLSRSSALPLGRTRYGLIRRLLSGSTIVNASQSPLSQYHPDALKFLCGNTVRDRYTVAKYTGRGRYCTGFVVHDSS